MTRPGAEWIGRRSQRTDLITDRQVAHFRMTLAGGLAPGEVPPGFHWTMILDTTEPDQLGLDGHPKLGSFLPDLGLSRRMWAGGSMLFHAPLRCGETLTRESVVADVAFKEGKSGRLGFVTVDHVWSVDGDIRIEESQNIVYRNDPKSGSAPAPEPAKAWPDACTWTFQPDPVLLFRYSAVTFNGHRIHYDQAYARGIEHYDGLVVHGPLQATWMLNLATDILGRLPARFRYRGVSPLICGDEVAVEARRTDVDIDLRVRRTRDGTTTTEGSAAP